METYRLDIEVARHENCETCRDLLLSLDAELSRGVWDEAAEFCKDLHAHFHPEIES